MNSDIFKIVGVTRDLVTIEILDPSEFKGQFNIGSYIKVPYAGGSDDHIVGIIKNYRIRNIDLSGPDSSPPPPSFVLEVELIGSYKNENGQYIFERGAHGIPLPPNNGVELLSDEDYKNIYGSKVKPEEKFVFSELIQNRNVRVPINGNRFFNKHFAIVGSTGSGKSHTTASVLQQAVREKSSGYEGLNNSHIIIFDIHGEYAEAFEGANLIDSSNIKIPYWLFDSDELRDLFIESTEQNSHNEV